MSVERKKDYTQVAIIQGTFIKEDGVQDFEDFFKTEFDTRVQYLETVLTKPDKDSDGNIIENTGGRSDVFFAIHDDDVSKFAVPRFKMGIRWIEDAVSIVNNENGIIYDKDVLSYVTWNEEYIEM